jgi:hypothetical protein
VERTGCRQHPTLLHHRLQRGGHAGRHGHEMALADEDERRPASPRTNPTWSAVRCRSAGTSLAWRPWASAG